MKTAETPMTTIVRLLGGSLTVWNGDDTYIAQAGISRFKDPLDGDTFSQVGYELLSRAFASRCRNPRDQANLQGCLEDHSYEVPTVQLEVVDEYMEQVAILLVLVAPLEQAYLPLIGINVGPRFMVHIKKSPMSRDYEVEINTLDCLRQLTREYAATHRAWQKPRGTGATPEQAFEAAIEQLRRRVLEQVAIDRLIGLFKRQIGPLAYSNHPYFEGAGSQVVMSWKRRGRKSFQHARGRDELHAVMAAIQGRLVCGYNAGKSCTLALGHKGDHVLRSGEIVRRRTA